jgi:hypothetical protein
MTLGRWLMGNTKDMEVRSTPDCLATHTRQLTSARCVRPQLTILMAQLGLACKATSRACAKAGIANLFGMAGDQNSSGDDQKKLDVLSNDIFVSALVNSGACSVLVSEEDEEPIIVPLEKAGRFCVAFDPLDGAPSLALTRSLTARRRGTISAHDLHTCTSTPVAGSSNIDCNVSTGAPPQPHAHTPCTPCTPQSATSGSSEEPSAHGASTREGVTVPTLRVPSGAQAPSSPCTRRRRPASALPPTSCARATTSWRRATACTARRRSWSSASRAAASSASPSTLRSESSSTPTPTCAPRPPP